MNIELAFERFQLEYHDTTCVKDWVEISYPFFRKKFCGWGLPPVIKSLGNSIAENIN